VTFSGQHDALFNSDLHQKRCVLPNFLK